MISIAFCFDENMAYPACVAIDSLIVYRGKCHYDIYCICTQKAKELVESKLKKIVMQDADSKIMFLPAEEYFQDAYEVRGITRSTYLRLMLHRLLPQLEQVIYSDVDILFVDSLAPIWDKLEVKNLLAAVKGTNSFSHKWRECLARDYSEELIGLEKEYINAGFLVMNLAAIREWNPDEIWNEMVTRKYFYQDQDILNITCKNRVSFLDIRYNVPANLVKKEFMCFAEDNIYSEEECRYAWENPVVIHYTGEKPWNNRGTNKAKVWWDFVDSRAELQGMFEKKKVKYRKTTGIMGKINRYLPW